MFRSAANMFRQSIVKEMSQTSAAVGRPVGLPVTPFFDFCFLGDEDDDFLAFLGDLDPLGILDDLELVEERRRPE